MPFYDYPIKLGEAMKENSLNFKKTRYKMAAIANVLRNFILCKQKDREYLLDYTCRFKVDSEVLTSRVGGLMCLLKVDASALRL